MGGNILIFSLFMWDETPMINKYKKFIAESDLTARINITGVETGERLESFETETPDIVLAGINKIIGENYSIIHGIKLKNPDMQLVCTGSKSKAADAWIYGCNSYIIKPVEKEDFLKCLKSRIIRYEQIRLYKQYSDIFAIKNRDAWVKVQYKDIIYFEKVRKKIKLVTEKNEYSFYGSLEDLRSMIDMDCFFQCHQGYIINRYRVKSYKSDVLLLRGSDVPIPVSRRMKKEAIGLFEYNNSAKS